MADAPRKVRAPRNTRSPRPGPLRRVMGWISALLGPAPATPIAASAASATAATPATATPAVVKPPRRSSRPHAEEFERLRQHMQRPRVPGGTLMLPSAEARAELLRMIDVVEHDIGPSSFVPASMPTPLAELHPVRADASPAAGGASPSALDLTHPPMTGVDGLSDSLAHGGGDPVRRQRLEQRLHDATLLHAEGRTAQAEGLLMSTLKERGTSALDELTWRALFDIYRFEQRHSEFAHARRIWSQVFGRPCPVWCTLTDRAQDDGAPATRHDGSWPALRVQQVNAAWCEAVLDTLSAGRSRVLMDWQSIAPIDPAMAGDLLTWMEQVSELPVTLRHIDLPRLLDRLEQTPPWSSRDEAAGVLAWLTVLRWLGQREPFEDMARTLSEQWGTAQPPWVPPACSTELGEAAMLTAEGSPARERLRPRPRPPAVRDLLPALQQAEHEVTTVREAMQTGAAPPSGWHVDLCDWPRLDLGAATDLLNWVDAQRSAGRSVRLVHVHLLVAQFLRLLGLDREVPVEPMR